MSWRRPSQHRTATPSVSLSPGTPATEHLTSLLFLISVVLHFRFASLNVYSLKLKLVVHLNIKLSFTHPHVIPNPYAVVLIVFCTIFKITASIIEVILLHICRYSRHTVALCEEHATILSFAEAQEYYLRPHVEIALHRHRFQDQWDICLGNDITYLRSPTTGERLL